MADAKRTIEPVLTKLERIQRQIGTVQETLMKLLVTEDMGEWDDTVQAALLRLEGGQRRIGEVQSGIIRQLAHARPPTRAGVPAPAGTATEPATAVAAAGAVHGETPTPASPAWIDPKQWLGSRNIRITSVRAPSGMDRAEEAIAADLGGQFAAVELFYEALKQRVSGGGKHWFPVGDSTTAAFKAIYQLGTRLKEAGFLTEFRYIRDRKSLLFEPVADGRIDGFLTGGWMERYALHLARCAVEQTGGVWHADQGLLGTSVLLPDGTATEFDVLVGLPGEKVLWIECKTGYWQNYLTHFRDLNRGLLQLPRQQAALVLLDRLPPEALASNSELCDMTVLHLTELAGWLTAAVAAA